MKIFRLNDCDWWIGETLDQCIADFKENYSDDESLEDPQELDDEELDSLTFIDADEEGFHNGAKRSFREQLAIEVAKGGDFPRMFASTEF